MHQCPISNKNLAQKIWKQLSYAPDAYNFMKNILSCATVYIFGGIVRDYLNNSIENVRDYDFVIEFKNDIHYKIPYYINNSQDIKIIKNRYDGYKILFKNNMIIDIWELKNTWAMQHDNFPVNFDNLINTVYLNIDKFAYCLTTEQFLGNCVERWNKLMKNNILDIVYTGGPFEELNLLRALVYMNKYKLYLSENLKERFRYYSLHSECFIYNLLYLQKSHFNKIIYDYDNLKNQLYSILS